MKLVTWTLFGVVLMVVGSVALTGSRPATSLNQGQPGSTHASRFAALHEHQVRMVGNRSSGLQEPQDESDEPEFSPEAIAHFETAIRPLLEEHCFKCHGAEAIQGGLNLTSRRGLLEGGDSGPAIDLEEAEYSVLVEAINYESYEMPPSGKLPAAEIALITAWIEAGAAWTPGDTGLEPAESRQMAPPVNAETMAFWSFQPVDRPDVPAVENAGWPTNDIDNFILAKLEANHLEPAPVASRGTLIRRLTYGLTGLPPTPDEVAAFLADDSPDAYETLVDRLLASPHYGEKWARHWLDLVRYAETNSYERDGAKPFVWRYRDYVIRSFNEDKPYDQFVIEQLAGDEIESVTPDSMIATGYYRLGLWDDEPADPKQAYYDGLDDVLMTTSQAFLGMTINCARCHDHKIDPIPQEDYYRLLAFFDNIQHYGVRGHDSVLQRSVREIATEEERAEYAEASAQHQQRLAEIIGELAAIEEKVKDDFIPVEHQEFEHEMNRVALVRKRVPEIISQEELDQYVALTEQRNRVRRHPPASLAQALCVTEKGAEPAETFVFIRGSAHAPGDAVTPGFPSVLSPPEPHFEPISNDQSSGRRLALANWIVGSENPLAARVMANRIWQHHFGRGIVRSSNDFGFQGTPPTHPELLDWLADEFVRGGWSMKQLHKTILMSSAYRMSSQASEQGLTNDPTNDLLWRFDMRRLTAEEIRDSVLAINGSINLESMYGPSIYTVIPREVLAGQSRPGSGWGNSSETERNRRSIYIHVKRSLVEPTLEVFDFADTDSTCPVRFATTQPTQALAMMNSAFINQEAEVLANLVRERRPDDLPAQIQLALTRVTQRKPLAEEVELGLELVENLQTEEGMTSEEALEFYCVMVFNLNEFLYLD